MADFDLTINSDGTITPDDISPDPGQTVSFTCSSDDAVVCVDPDTVFGGERYEVPQNQTVTLTVQQGAEHIEFAFLTILGDLNASCSDGSRTGGVNGSGGTTGP